MELAMDAEIQSVLFSYMHCTDPNGSMVKCLCLLHV